MRPSKQHNTDMSGRHPERRARHPRLGEDPERPLLEDVPRLRPVASNTAALDRPMIIQNLASGGAYRSTCGVYNLRDSSVQAEFRLIDGAGATVGSPFVRSFEARDFLAFDPFVEAGAPYPGRSFDNVVLLVRPISGSGALLCFGVSVHNDSNDPADHFAVLSR